MSQSKQWLMVCYAGRIADDEVGKQMRVQAAEVNAMGLFPSDLVVHLKPGAAPPEGDEEFDGCVVSAETEEESQSCLGNGAVTRSKIPAASVVDGMGAGHKFALARWLALPRIDSH